MAKRLQIKEFAVDGITDNAKIFLPTDINGNVSNTYQLDCHFLNLQGKLRRLQKTMVFCNLRSLPCRFKKWQSSWYVLDTFPFMSVGKKIFALSVIPSTANSFICSLFAI